jgi:acetyltransferase-like isoleucine patch superfamily enzyme
MALSERLETLWRDLRELHHHLRSETYRKYKRINPFYEDLFDWKERGAFWVDAQKNITIYNSTSLVGDVDIGDNTWIGPFCSLDGNGGLRIGRYCSVSLGCQLVSHDSVKWALSGGRNPHEYGPIVIEDHCYLGSHAVITKGVTVGHHSVVAAGAVVTRDVPPCSIVGGVPGRIIGTVRIDADGMVALDYERSKSRDS